MAKKTFAERMALARARRAAAAPATTTIIQAAPPARGRAARRAVSAVRSGAVRVIRSQRLRQGAKSVVRGAGVMALAQARILPALVGGYGVAMIERNQRIAHSKQVESTTDKDKPAAGGALIKSPTQRIVVMSLALAFAATKTTGLAREAICGAAGGLGAIYESYRADKGNPNDAYLKEIEAGNSGI